MYPVPPESHRPTNRYGILLVCLAVVLGLFFMAIRQLSAGMNNAAAGEGQIQLIGQPRAGVTPLALATATAIPTPVPTPATTELTAKELAASPTTYRSRSIRVAGTVYYLGRTDDGKQWIQIVSENVYVDGVFSGNLPGGVSKGASVTLTGIGAGLYQITAADGKQYDQPYIDPIQRIDVG